MSERGRVIFLIFCNVFVFICIPSHILSPFVNVILIFLFLFYGLYSAGQRYGVGTSFVYTNLKIFLPLWCYMQGLQAPIYAACRDLLLLFIQLLYIFSVIFFVIFFVIYIVLDTTIIAHSNILSNVINVGTWVILNGCKPYK